MSEIVVNSTEPFVLVGSIDLNINKAEASAREIAKLMIYTLPSIVSERVLEIYEIWEEGIGENSEPEELDRYLDGLERSY